MSTPKNPMVTLDCQTNQQFWYLSTLLLEFMTCLQVLKSSAELACEFPGINKIVPVQIDY